MSPARSVAECCTTTACCTPVAVVPPPGQVFSNASTLTSGHVEPPKMQDSRQIMSINVVKSTNHFCRRRRALAGSSIGECRSSTGYIAGSFDRISLVSTECNWRIPSAGRDIRTGRRGSI